MLHWLSTCKNFHPIFLLIIACFLLLLFNSLSRGSYIDNLLAVMVKKEDFHQKFQYHGFSLYFLVMFLLFYLQNKLM